MSIAYKVLSMVNAVRKDSTMLGAWLEALELEARRAFDGAYVALMSPIAEDTWETSVTMLSTDDESNPAEVNFPRPVEVIGFFFSVRPLSFAPAFPLVQPTAEDILVAVELDKKDKLTAHEVDQTVQGGPVDFVTMASLDMRNANRLIGKKCEAPKPVLRFFYRPKQGPNVFVDMDISVAVAWRFL